MESPLRVSAHVRCLGTPGTHAVASHDRRHARKSAPHCRACKAKRELLYQRLTACGLHSRLHAGCDGNRQPVRIALTEGQRSGDDGAPVLLADHTVTKRLLADTA